MTKGRDLLLALTPVEFAFALQAPFLSRILYE